jgi:hypothetical protein
LAAFVRAERISPIITLAMPSASERDETLFTLVHKWAGVALEAMQGSRGVLANAGLCWRVIGQPLVGDVGRRWAYVKTCCQTKIKTTPRKITQPILSSPLFDMAPPP